MIENSDRGITINKGLAYTMVAGLVSFGFYFGTTISDVQQSIQVLDGRLSSQATSSNGREMRIRTLETDASRFDERVSNILGLLSRIDGRLERIERAQKTK